MITQWLHSKADAYITASFCPTQRPFFPFSVADIVMYDGRLSCSEPGIPEVLYQCWTVIVGNI